MKFIIRAGCSLENVEEAIETDSLMKAEEYAATIASESFSSFGSYFEGMVEVELEEYELEEDTPEYQDEYDNRLYAYEIEDTYYEAEEFDSENEEHLAILELQEGEFYEI